MANGFGVTTDELERFFRGNGETMKSQFVGVFPADQKEENVIEGAKGKKYLFIIANTDSSAKSGEHWWSFLDTDEKGTVFLFASLGTYGLLSFIVQNDLDVFNRLMPGQVKQIFQKDNRRTLLSWSFKMDKYSTLKEKDLRKLHLQPNIFSNSCMHLASKKSWKKL